MGASGVVLGGLVVVEVLDDGLVAGPAGVADGGSCVDSEFVVAAAQILQEGMPGDHHRRGPVGL